MMFTSFHSMSFWDAAEVEENSLCKLLKTPNPQLDDILIDQYMLQELRSENRELIELLTTRENMLKIVRTALHPISCEDIPLEEQYKLSFICSEILTVRSNDRFMVQFVACDEAMKVLMESLNKPETINHLIASFFVKILTVLVERQYTKLLPYLTKNNILQKCTALLRFGAMVELLSSLPRMVVGCEETHDLKQLFIEQEFAKNLVSLLDPQQTDDVHANAAEVYIDLVKNIRDILCTFEDKEDAINDLLTSDDIVKDILNRMLMRDADGHLNNSILENCADMLQTLISTNCIMFCPSHLLENERFCEIGESDLPSKQEDTVWKPDERRVAETMVASRAEEILKIIIDDLESENPGDNWWILLRLLVSLLNTNYLPTHTTLCAAFKNAGFHKLFDLVWKHQQNSAFHHQLHKIVAYSMFSNTGDVPSPLIHYFFSDCKLIDRLLLGMKPICVLKKLNIYALRSFHVHLIVVLLQAKHSGHNSDAIDVQMKLSSEEWEATQTLYNNWCEWNRSGEAPPNSSRSSNEPALDDEAMAFYQERLRVQSLTEIHNGEPTRLLPDAFDPFPTRPVCEVDKFSIERGMSPHKVSLNIYENSVDESDFEDLCNLHGMADKWPTVPKSEAEKSESLSNREDRTQDDWPSTSRRSVAASVPDPWPKANGVSSELVSDPFSVNWDKVDVPKVTDFSPLSNGTAKSKRTSTESSKPTDLDDWPTPSEVKEKDEKSDDIWADFTSQRTSSFNNSSDSWPGEAPADPDPDNSGGEWNNDFSSATTSPATIGLATAIDHPAADFFASPRFPQPNQPELSESDA